RDRRKGYKEKVRPPPVSRVHRVGKGLHQHVSKSPPFVDPQRGGHDVTQKPPRSSMHHRSKFVRNQNGIDRQFAENGVRTRLRKSHRAVIHFRSFTGGRIGFVPL